MTFLNSGDVGADSELHTPTVARVQAHICYGDIVTSKHYIHLYRKEKKITRVRFDTAVTVDDAVKSHLQDKLRKETGCTIEFSGHVEPELIGGFRLRM